MSVCAISAEGTEIDRARIQKYLDNNLMLVTALSPTIGYQNTAHIAESANQNGATLPEADVRSGKVTEKQFDEIIEPHRMIGDGALGRVGTLPHPPGGTTASR